MEQFAITSYWLLSNADISTFGDVFFVTFNIDSINYLDVIKFAIQQLSMLIQHLSRVYPAFYPAFYPGFIHPGFIQDLSRIIQDNPGWIRLEPNCLLFTWFLIKYQAIYTTLVGKRTQRSNLTVVYLRLQVTAMNAMMSIILVLCVHQHKWIVMQLDSC